MPLPRDLLGTVGRMNAPTDNPQEEAAAKSQSQGSAMMPTVLVIPSTGTANSILANLKSESEAADPPTKDFLDATDLTRDHWLKIM